MNENSSHELVIRVHTKLQENGVWCTDGFETDLKKMAPEGESL